MVVINSLSQSQSFNFKRPRSSQEIKEGSPKLTVNFSKNTLQSNDDLGAQNLGNWIYSYFSFEF